MYVRTPECLHRTVVFSAELFIQIKDLYEVGHAQELVEFICREIFSDVFYGTRECDVTGLVTAAHKPGLEILPLESLQRFKHDLK